jgi:porphobilinogen synthase
MRTADWVRELIAETRLHPSDLILPIFVCEGQGIEDPIATMPGVSRLSIDKAVDMAKHCYDTGIKLIALFPSIDSSLKDEDGTLAFDENNIVCRAIREIKKRVPGIGVMADVALDPYTTHGHDGILVNHKIANNKQVANIGIVGNVALNQHISHVEADSVVDNDQTVAALIKQSMVLARAGCDVVAPSDMMDGRVMMIRKALESEGHQDTIIMSYAAKYNSSFYGPFRDAVNSKRKDGSYLDKRTYQMDMRNSIEAMREIKLDEAEGADMIIVKPGMPFLDIITKAAEASTLPIIAYQVSGEYAMLKFAGLAGAMDYERSMLESLITFKRAGCRAILTYAALEIAERL